jgi:hypothetical protein
MSGWGLGVASNRRAGGVSGRIMRRLEFAT